MPIEKTIDMFINSECMIRPGLLIRRQTLYKYFRQFIKKDSLDKASKKKFSQILHDSYQVSVLPDATRHKTYLLGISHVSTMGITDEIINPMRTPSPYSTTERVFVNPLIMIDRSTMPTFSETLTLDEFNRYYRWNIAEDLRLNELLTTCHRDQEIQKIQQYRQILSIELTDISSRNIVTPNEVSSTSTTVPLLNVIEFVTENTPLLQGSQSLQMTSDAAGMRAVPVPTVHPDSSDEESSSRGSDEESSAESRDSDEDSEPTERPVVLRNPFEELINDLGASSDAFPRMTTRLPVETEVRPPPTVEITPPPAPANNPTNTAANVNPSLQAVLDIIASLDRDN